MIPMLALSKPGCASAFHYYPVLIIRDKDMHSMARGRCTAQQGDEAGTCMLWTCVGVSNVLAWWSKVWRGDMVGRGLPCCSGVGNRGGGRHS